MVSPYGGRLYSKAQALEALLAERHLFQGLVLPHVVLPPLGRADHQTGDYERACLATGRYLAAESWRWLVTREAEARDRARQSAAALLGLQTITGSSHAFARGFKQAGEASWDEALYPLADQWRQAGEYRWLGAPDVAALAGRTFGLCLYFDLAAEEGERAALRDDFRRVVGGLLDDDLQLTDPEGRPLPGGALGPGADEPAALHALCQLKCAWHVTGDSRFAEAYRRLVRDHGYAQRAAAAAPRAVQAGAGEVGLAALYHLLAYETDPDLLPYYRISLDRFWEPLSAEAHPFYSLVYRAYNPNAEIDPAWVDTLRAYEPVRHTRVFPRRAVAPQPALVGAAARGAAGPTADTVQGVTEDAPHPFLRAYWMARAGGELTAEA